MERKDVHLHDDATMWTWPTLTSVVSVSDTPSQSSSCRRRRGRMDDAQPADVEFHSGTGTGVCWTTSWVGKEDGDTPRPIRSLMFFSIVSRRKFLRLQQMSLNL